MTVTDVKPPAPDGAPAPDEPDGAAPADQPEAVVWSRPVLLVLAALSFGAGLIHLAMVPAHAGEWLPEGLAFAAAGWLQIALAAVLVLRPSRAAILVGCIANTGFVVAWAVSRRWGLPVGPGSGVAEAASFVDLTCVAFEVALVALGAALIRRPGLAASPTGAGRTALAIAGVGALVVATAAIASPSASGHDHGDGHGADHGNAAAGPVAGDHDAAGGHEHGAAAPGDDKGLSLIMNGAGEGGGHVHNTSVVPVDAATQAQLDAQLAKMQHFITSYPTVKDAEAAGYHRQGPYSPGLGAHYAERGRPVVSRSTTMTDEALEHPMLIFDGIAPDSKLAGFMYMIFSTDTEHSPEGFIGPNDHWHYHTNVCIKMRPDGATDTPLGADTSATKELCDKYGGFLIANTGYMVHVWPVPGYESPQGLFSNLNTKLTCPNGTYYTVKLDEIGSRTNLCSDVPD